MLILAISAKDREYLYKANTAHAVCSAEIENILNNWRHLMKVNLMKRGNAAELEKSLRYVDGMYRDVIEIFEEYCTRDAIKALSEDFRSYLEHVNDFEGMGFYVINNCMVMTVDSLLGHVLGVQTLADFLHETYKYYQEEYQEGYCNE